LQTALLSHCIAYTAPSAARLRLALGSSMAISM
jgi:hypothetical protein